MTIHWAYENWRANGHKLIVHKAECRFCNNGKGLSGGTRPDNGTWHNLGDFGSPTEALEYARRIVKASITRLCGACAPKAGGGMER
jgi:hypothetical protein